MHVQRAEVVHTSVMAPPHELIAFLADMNNWPTWAPWVRSVRRLSPRDWTRGRRGSMVRADGPHNSVHLGVGVGLVGAVGFLVTTILVSVVITFLVHDL